MDLTLSCDNALRITNFFIDQTITTPHHQHDADSAAAADTPGHAQVWQLINVKLLTTDFLAAGTGAASSASDVVELLGKTPANFARLLDERAARAHHVNEHIHQHTSADRLFFTQTPAYYRPEVESEQRQQPVDKTVLADSLGVLSHRVARTDIGQQA